MLADIVKNWLVPGSLTFLYAGVAIGVLLLFAGPTGALYGRAWMMCLLALYFLLSLPVVSGWLIGRLHRDFPTIRTREEAGGTTVLVVFGNGAVHYAAGAASVDLLTRRSYFCVFEALRLYGLLEPTWVIVSGGVAGPDNTARAEADVMREALVGFGVPGHCILVESRSRKTSEQMANIAELLTTQGLGPRVIVVTTGAHMSRVMDLARSTGIDAIPSVTPELRYGDAIGWQRWCPSYSALIGSQSACYEYLALVNERFKLAAL